MDTELARTFLMVVAAGNFIGAAERLHVTQSTVSARIHALETQLRCRLFVRNKAGAVLTPAGRQFQRHASTLVRTVEQARSDVGIARGFRASLVVGGRFGLWERYLLRWLSLMREQVPDVSVRAEIANELEAQRLSLQAANDQLAVLEADLAAQNAARSEAENRIVQLSKQAREAASHGLEQARLDALRAVVNIVEDLRRVATAPDGEVLSASDLHLAASTQGQVLGVVTLEQAGDTVPFDPMRHRLIDQARPQDGTPQVRVIEPTYALRSGDSVTVLRYGRVTGS